MPAPTRPVRAPAALTAAVRRNRVATPAPRRGSPARGSNRRGSPAPTSRAASRRLFLAREAAPGTAAPVEAPEHAHQHHQHDPRHAASHRDQVSCVRKIPDFFRRLVQDLHDALGARVGGAVLPRIAPRERGKAGERLAQLAHGAAGEIIHRLAHPVEHLVDGVAVLVEKGLALGRDVVGLPALGLHHPHVPLVLQELEGRVDRARRRAVPAAEPLFHCLDDFVPVPRLFAKQPEDHVLHLAGFEDLAPAPALAVAHPRAPVTLPLAWPTRRGPRLPKMSENQSLLPGHISHSEILLEIYRT